MPLLCKVCDSSKDEEDVRTLEECQHKVCTDCLKEYVEQKIAERETKLKCPHYKCDTVLGNEVIQSCVSPESYHKLEHFRWVDSMQQNPLLRWCPQTDCEGYGLLSPAHTPKVTCNTCGFEFCEKCQGSFHGAEKCVATGEELKAVKFCPRCRVRVERAAGCSHMMCPRCGFQWCWLCGKAYFSMHFLSCSVERSKLLHPTCDVILFFTLLPIIAFIALLILSALWLPDLVKELGRSTKAFELRRWIRLPLGVLSLLLAPLPIAIICICLGSALMADFGRYLRENPHPLSSLANHEGYWLFLTIFLGLLLSPIVVALGLLLIALGPVIGAALLLVKWAGGRQGEGGEGEVQGYRLGED